MNQYTSEIKENIIYFFNIQFWSNYLHITLQATLVFNNLGFICINNMFLIGFDPRVLVLNRNLF
jgi:hypothetical protein